MSFAVKLNMHLKLGSGGSVYVRELTDYPGIIVTDVRPTAKDKVQRVIEWSGREYKTIAEAVEDYKEKQNENQTSQNQR